MGNTLAIRKRRSLKDGPKPRNHILLPTKSVKNGLKRKSTIERVARDAVPGELEKEGVRGGLGKVRLC